jgi:hypothetical protein
MLVPSSPAGQAAIVLGAALLCACGQEQSAQTDGATIEDSGIEDWSRPDHLIPDTVTISGLYWDSTNKKPAEAFEVCLYLGLTKGTCLKTDASGVYAHKAPGGAEVGLMFDKQGYQRGFISMVPKKSFDLGMLSVFDDAEAKAKHALAGASYPPTKNGDILVNLHRCLKGTTVRLSTSAGIGPVYLDKNDEPDPSLKATSRDGGGGAWFFDVPPGEVHVSCATPSGLCAMAAAWPSKTSTARVPVIAGAYSAAILMCAR